MCLWNGGMTTQAGGEHGEHEGRLGQGDTFWGRDRERRQAMRPEHGAGGPERPQEREGRLPACLSTMKKTALAKPWQQFFGFSSTCLLVSSVSALGSGQCHRQRQMINITERFLWEMVPGRRRPALGDPALQEGSSPGPASRAGQQLGAEPEGPGQGGGPCAASSGGRQVRRPVCKAPCDSQLQGSEPQSQTELSPDVSHTR